MNRLTAIKIQKVNLLCFHWNPNSNLSFTSFSKEFWLSAYKVRTSDTVPFFLTIKWAWQGHCLFFVYSSISFSNSFFTLVISHHDFFHTSMEPLLSRVQKPLSSNIVLPQYSFLTLLLSFFLLSKMTSTDSTEIDVLVFSMLGPHLLWLSLIYSKLPPQTFWCRDSTKLILSSCSFPPCSFSHPFPLIPK